MQKPRGTIDYLEKDSKEKNYILDIIKKQLNIFNYSQIETPIFESIEVFNKSAGELSDIVNKEMYIFKDKKQRMMALRPEGTAGVARMFIENKLFAISNVQKFYYYGPMFRYERSQKGRYRQFNQLGIEVFGQKNVSIDYEVISLLSSIISRLGIKNYYFKINSIGSVQTISNYSKEITNYFKDYKNDLCKDCQTRLEQKNPMRILDCKNDANKDFVKNSPKINNFLTKEEKSYYEDLLILLKDSKIEFIQDDNLVRGLDYYTSIIFELIIDGLTICGGGRYDDLIKNFSNNKYETNAIGFAIGIERLLLILKEKNLIPDLKKKLDYFIIVNDPKDPKNIIKADLEINKLRKKGFIVERDLANRKVEKQYKLKDQYDVKEVIKI